MFVILSDIWLDNEEVTTPPAPHLLPNYFWFNPLLSYDYLLLHSPSVEKTMEKLETILSGYENVDVVPSLFVFMGNFCSHPCNLSFNSYSSIR